MRILLTGATGFIGKKILGALLRNGHSVTACVRDTVLFSKQYPKVKCLSTNFTTDVSETIWIDRLKGIDCVINAVGIIREDKKNTFETLHTKAPIALFTAAKRVKTRLVVQISAVGADADARTQYHISKLSADNFLRDSGIPHIIVRPSLVMGPGAESSGLFSFLAMAPVLPLPGGGNQMLQPIHIDDLAEGIIKLIQNKKVRNSTLDAVGGKPYSLRQILSVLRPGNIPALIISSPMFLFKILAHLRIGLLEPGAISMLERGNTGNVDIWNAKTGMKAGSLEEFWDSRTTSTIAWQVARNIFLKASRLTIAMVWIGTAIVTWFLYPHEESLGMLARAGIPASAGVFTLASACITDAILGFSVFTRYRKIFYMIQIVAVIFFTVLLSFTQYHFWLHPFGPLTKNLPLLALTALCAWFDE